MTEPVKAEDFVEAAENALSLALAQAQDRLRSQVDLARAADSRAQNLLSVCAAFTGAAVAGGLTALVNDRPEIFFAGFAAAGVWLLGAIWALRSMTPIKMDVPGWPPSSLVSDFRAGKTYQQIVADMLVHLDDMIADNRKLITENSKLTTTSMFFLVAAPIAGALVGGAGYLVKLAL